MKRISWDQYFMLQSIILSTRSTCQRLMVGATLVKDHRIIAGGYNGSISGEDHCIENGCLMENNHCIRTIHAEMNALLQCSKFGVSTQDAELFVTHFPCLACTKAVIAAGIKHIYYLHDYHNHPYALELFRKAKVEVHKVEMNRELISQIEQLI